MSKPIELALVGAALAVSIVLFHWWTLLILLFAGIGYLVGRHLEGTLDFSAAWRALTSNIKSTSE
ncbi:DUF2273 domain-containing protein [Actinomycetaceae bacterium TAE3-ERU4]|nr:DUF2273 domain-containing protein [Actinomycetaceae bacterium TAE3-ERU4]